MIKCKNCNMPVDGKFCRNCGQKANVTPISISSLIHDVPHAIFHVDRGILHNLVQFFKRPGSSINEYLAGKRKPYYHPVSYLVLSLVLNYLVVKITDLHFYDEGELISMESSKAKAIRDYDEMQWWFLEHTYIYILIAIPASALFLWGMFKLAKQKYNLAETAVVVLFTIAQGVLIQSFIYLCFGWVDSGPFLRTVEMINVCILILYASIVMYQLFPSRMRKILRIIFSFAGGFGLAVVWVASAYLLYVVWT